MYTYTIHRIFIEPEAYLQGGSFQRFHDIYFFKTGVISGFFKFNGKYELDKELSKFL